jgi:hypothetical protein
MELVSAWTILVGLAGVAEARADAAPAQAKRLEVTLHGPFENDKARELGDVDSDFVEPIRAGARREADGTRTDFRVYFTFKGKEDASRTIQTRFTALDAAGNVVTSQAEKWSDPRPAARVPVRAGSAYGLTSRVCVETIRLPQADADRVAVIKITFIEP